MLCSADLDMLHLLAVYSRSIAGCINITIFAFFFCTPWVGIHVELSGVHQDHILFCLNFYWWVNSLHAYVKPHDLNGCFVGVCKCRVLPAGVACMCSCIYSMLCGCLLM